MPAPVASGWSESPGGPCTHWKSAALSRRTWEAVIRSPPLVGGVIPTFIADDIAQKRNRLDAKLVEQCLCFFEVGCVEPFGEPAVDGRQQVTPFVSPALFAPQPGQACGGAQLP